MMLPSMNVKDCLRQVFACHLIHARQMQLALYVHYFGATLRAVNLDFLFQSKGKSSLVVQQPNKHSCGGLLKIKAHSYCSVSDWLVNLAIDR